MNCRSEKREEKWRRIETDEKTVGWYEVSDMGRVRHVLKHSIKMLNPSAHKKDNGEAGYYEVSIGGKHRILARLVYRAFAGEIPKGMCVVHRNGLKSDNSVRNLILRDPKMIGRKYGCRQNYLRPVVRMDRDGNVLDVYRSARSAAKETGKSHTCVVRRCNHTTGKDMLEDGTTFRYEDEVEGLYG